MDAELLNAILAVGGPMAVLGAVMLGRKLYHEARRRLDRNPRPPLEAVRRIRGTAVALTPIRSPVDQCLCVLAGTRVMARPRAFFTARPRAELATANDFVVQTPDGPFVVRASDLWVRDSGPASGILNTSRLPEALAEAIRGAGLDPEVELHYRETVVFPGQEVIVVGAVKDELPPAALRDTYREGACIPTVSGGGGAVEVEPVPQAVGSEAGATTTSPRSSP